MEFRQYKKQKNFVNFSQNRKQENFVNFRINRKQGVLLTLVSFKHKIFLPTGLNLSLWQKLSFKVYIYKVESRMVLKTLDIIIGESFTN